MSFLKDFKDLKKDISMTVSETEGQGEVTENKTEGVSRPSGNTEISGSAHGNRNQESDGESTVIAMDAMITGNLESKGSIAVYGTVHGNIHCDRKLIVTGKVYGNLNAGEIFINKASIEGEIVSEGNLKIGNASVILGDIYGKTAVIAGAVKGEIDIKGPVIIDNTAVIKGNIKSASVQINNGAVIEGYCTQCYHDIDVNSIFDETFPKNTKEEQAAEMDEENSITEEASVTDMQAAEQQGTAEEATEQETSGGTSVETAEQGTAADLSGQTADLETVQANDKTE